MTYRAKWPARAGAGILLALVLGMMERITLADDDPNVTKTVITVHHGATLEDNQAKGLIANPSGLTGNPKGLSQPNNPYADRSFSGGGSDLMRMHAQAFAADNTTNAPSTNATTKAHAQKH